MRTTATHPKGAAQPLLHWRPPPWPSAEVLEGSYARLERLRVSHAAELFEANSVDETIWDFLPYGPFATLDAYTDWIAARAAEADPHFYAIRDLATGRAAGVASYLRINPAAGSIEVGHINLSPALQRTPAATEAMVLMMRWAFEAGYRRYEWKCDAANLASRRAAQRLGLSHEGVFRQAAVVKGRNRDTAWFAAIDAEWPGLQAVYNRWLARENFDAEGRQRLSLSSLTRPLLAATDPALEL
ncbi:MAG: N-acetyltransferase [Alphaproteobacteria bacterium]|nr:MAG: N-acetyltransferase [Alphaproteobacteria bacterium]